MFILPLRNQRTAGLDPASPHFDGYGDLKRIVDEVELLWQEELQKLGGAVVAEVVEEVMDFLIERLRVQLRTEGARYDVLNAVLGTGLDDDFTRLLARTAAVAEMLGTEDGVNLLAGYRRAANILRIEEKKDGPHDRGVDQELLEAGAEQALAGALDRAEPAVTALLEGEEFGGAMAEFAALRPYLDAFFTDVTVNDPRAEVRLNRLALLARVRAVMGRVADFSRIEG